MIVKRIMHENKSDATQNVLVSPRADFLYNPHSFLTCARNVRSTAPQFFTADSPHNVATCLDATNLLRSVYHFLMRY